MDVLHMRSDTELLLKKSRDLIAIAEITVSESGAAIRRAQQLLTAVKLSKVRPTSSDTCSHAPSSIYALAEGRKGVHRCN
jgi:hypothetical protein